MLRRAAARLRPTSARSFTRRAGSTGCSKIMSTAARAASTTTTTTNTKVEGIPKEPTDLDNITTLRNGLRVASEALPGSFAGVGVYVEAGSRFETPALCGVSHIMDRLAFKSTSAHTADQMLERVEHLGGNIQCASSRESMMYQAATFNDAVPSAVGLLAETIRDPSITAEEVAQQLETARYEIAEIWAKPDLIIPELVHTAAFKDNTLGNPLLCPEERLGSIGRDTVLTYRDLFYRPERMVLAFAGVEHSAAVGLAERFFGDMSSSKAAASSTDTPASSEPAASTLTTPTRTTATSLSQYTGGFLSLPAQPPSLQGTNFTHIHVAFEGLPAGSDDIYALATLQTLLGGGGSFSAGGPGKGMYSRLYTNVLNQYGWVESCVSFNHSYTDSGLFGIQASCLPGHTSAMLDVICQELRALTLESGFSRLQDGEVARAKNQLRSSLLMNLESRMVELEDLGRSVQVHGHKIPVREMCRRIEALTVKDLRRVANLVLGGQRQQQQQQQQQSRATGEARRGSGAPTVVVQEAQAYGLTSHSMSWDQIQDRIDGWKLGRR